MKRMENKKETAVEWLTRMLHSPVCNGFINGNSRAIPHDIIEQAKQMEKEQLNIARLDGINLANKGYGSKGSVFLEGYEQIDQNNPVTRGSTALVKVTSSQTEISDEEIEKEAEFVYPISKEYKEKYKTIYDDFNTCWKEGAKWYREQLKSKK